MGREIFCKMLCFALMYVFIINGCKQVKKEVDYGSPRVKQELLNDQMFIIKKYATDKKYGYTEKYPIMVGGIIEGPINQRRFLNALTGPKGEQISYRRLASCCPFYTKNALFDNSGRLDKYQITYEGLEAPIILYINMYDSDELKVPVGFRLKYKK